MVRPAGRLSRFICVALLYQVVSAANQHAGLHNAHHNAHRKLAASSEASASASASSTSAAASASQKCVVTLPAEEIQQVRQSMQEIVAACEDAVVKVQKIQQGGEGGQIYACYSAGFIDEKAGTFGMCQSGSSTLELSLLF